jgi:hypothetical protein
MGAMSFGAIDVNAVNASVVTKNGTTDRYRARRTIHVRPSNPGEYSLIETQVQNYFGRDKEWYDACSLDNATSWKASERQNGGDKGIFFDRACPNTGLHPMGVHWNPFVTHDHNCSATAKIELEIVQNHFWEGWTIKTFDARGVPKRMGGDAFYIVYSEYLYGSHGLLHDDGQPLMPTAVGIPKENYNGNYGLDFVSVPFLDPPSEEVKHNGQRKMGRLTIHVITTCFIGELFHPLKDGWKTGGQTNVTWTIENVGRPFKIQDWKNDRYLPRQRDTMVHNKLSDFDSVVFAGDSVLNQMTWDVFGKRYYPFVSEKMQSGAIWKRPTQDNGSPVVLNMPLSPTTLPAFVEALDSWIRDGLNDKKSKHNKNALVLGSAAWDVIWPAEWQGPKFQNHLSALEALLKRLRDTHPEVTLVWKLPYAQHMHSANIHDKCFAEPSKASDDGTCVRAFRYATRERFEGLYKAQKQFIQKKFEGDVKIRLLDLYDVSYLAGSYWINPGDTIHYRPEFNAAILEQLLYAEPAPAG